MTQLFSPLVSHWEDKLDRLAGRVVHFGHLLKSIEKLLNFHLANTFVCLNHRTRCWGWCTCGPCVETKRSWTPTQPGDSWISLPPALNRSSETNTHIHPGLEDWGEEEAGWTGEHGITTGTWTSSADHFSNPANSSSSMVLGGPLWTASYGCPSCTRLAVFTDQDRGDPDWIDLCSHWVTLGAVVHSEQSLCPSVCHTMVR